MPNWSEVLREVQVAAVQAQQRSQSALDDVRHKYLTNLSKHTSRNVIAYYSGWLSKPNVAQGDINDEDKNGFMMAVHQLDRRKGLDLILHTPGGGIAATQSIVHYLRKMFNDDIRAIVPQLAMSAGTMIACCCKVIVMGKQSNLGPIDPHMRGIPAQGVIKEFRRAIREIKKDPATVAIWQPIISQYRPTFLSQCEQAIQWSNAFVESQLIEVMFRGEREANKKAIAIRKFLSDYSKNKTHDRHIHADECKAQGLKIIALEDDPQLQDLVLTIHHCYMHVFMNLPAYKIIENHLGNALIKNAVRAPTLTSPPTGEVQPLLQSRVSPLL
jgi:ATP-dependent protease ClpP protease subunit